MTDARKRLVADVGGTNTRIALFDENAGEMRALRTYTNREHASLESVLDLWFGDLQETPPDRGCIAAAAPPSGDRISMVNIDWSFSCSELQQRYGFTAFRWLNDFQANAHALPHLAEGDREELRAGQSAEGARLATMGPGTGLGGATLEWVDGVPRACDSEPGHTGLSPANELELEIFRLLVPRHGEIYAEFLVSGAGLERLYRVLSEIRGNAPEPLTPAEVSARALAGSDASCVQALETFCALLGSACGDFVLSNGAYGGLYLAGGIVPRMLPFLKASSFEQRFREKGEMSPHLDLIPLYAITTAQPGLLGAAHAPL